MSAPHHGRTALVTGSARRVGRILAHALVARGWTVCIHATDATRAEAARVELGAAAAVGADLADPGCAGVVAAAVATMLDDTNQGLDLLVNCAATFERTSWCEATVESWHTAFDVNARAPWLLTCALADRLERAQGAVVNISDLAAHEHWMSHPLHAASKAALESLTQSGARALASRNIRMNAIAPATVLAEDGWTAERIEAERRAGRMVDPQRLVHEVLELANGPARTGEIVILRD